MFLLPIEIEERLKKSLCPYCQEDFSICWDPKWKLKIHIKKKHAKALVNTSVTEETTDGTKPFSCNYCNQSFHQITQLVDHMKTHTGKWILKFKILVIMASR